MGQVIFEFAFSSVVLFISLFEWVFTVAMGFCLVILILNLLRQILYRR